MMFRPSASPTLPPGFELVLPGSGRTNDLSIAYRRVSNVSFRTVVCFGRRTLAEIGVKEKQSVWAVVGINPEYTRMVVMLRDVESAPAIRGTFKDGVLYFVVRLERLSKLREKRSAVSVAFDVTTHHDDPTHPGNPTHTFTISLPPWMQADAGPNNTVAAATERARQAAQDVRRRAGV